jgi:hypothetical protein
VREALIPGTRQYRQPGVLGESRIRFAQLAQQERRSFARFDEARMNAVRAQTSDFSHVIILILWWLSLCRFETLWNLRR